jgi:hypothetical protein
MFRHCGLSKYIMLMPLIERFMLCILFSLLSFVFLWGAQLGRLGYGGKERVGTLKLWRERGEVYGVSLTTLISAIVRVQGSIIFFPFGQSLNHKRPSICGFGGLGFACLFWLGYDENMFDPIFL